MIYTQEQIEAAAHGLRSLDAPITATQLKLEVERIVAVPGRTWEIVEWERREFAGRIRQTLRPTGGPAKEFARHQVLPHDPATRIVCAFQLRFLLRVAGYRIPDDRLATIEEIVERIVSVLLASPGSTVADRAASGGFQRARNVLEVRGSDVDPDLTILGSHRLPGTHCIAVLCDDDMLYPLEVPERLLRREPDLALKGLTVGEAGQRIRCRTELVDRALAWVQAVKIHVRAVSENDVHVDLSDGEQVWLGTVSSSWLATLHATESPLLGLTRVQAGAMVQAAASGSPEDIRLDRPPCAACDRLHR